MLLIGRLFFFAKIMTPMIYVTGMPIARMAYCAQLRKRSTNFVENCYLCLKLYVLRACRVWLYDGKPTTCDLQILPLPNFRVVLQNG